MGDYTGYPGDLSEESTLARLTVLEKRRIARAAILEFPHLNHGMLDEWLRGHGADDAAVGDTMPEKVDALLDRCEILVRSGEDPRALDHFIHGYLSPATLRALGIDPDEVATRDTLDVWEGVYDA